MEEEMDSALHDGNRSPPKNGSGSKPVTTSTPKTNSSGPALSDLQKLCNVILSNASVSGTNNSTLEVPPGENLVRVGEVLTLTRSQHMDAKLARTPSAMTMELIRVTFSDKRLKRSSYAGQKRTRNGVVEQKPSLKKYRSTKDIQNFVNQRFPHFTQSQFSHAVNACTGNNVGQTPKPKLVDLSDSEGED
ncbi:uncharacterized protein LOC117640528 [Thrips palmi]|uniref:Uncharacterized protein LOC117640528 n=1 Tax=Thrips palmi TaxID=161013 RepID=A0A6P8ZI41_THRPL|nr:uncharacterized protein LOC117640528 [Thrips palmi]